MKRILTVGISEATQLTLVRDKDSLLIETASTNGASKLLSAVEPMLRALEQRLANDELTSTQRLGFDAMCKEIRRQLKAV